MTKSASLDSFSLDSILVQEGHMIVSCFVLVFLLLVCRSFYIGELDHFGSTFIVDDLNGSSVSWL